MGNGDVSTDVSPQDGGHGRSVQAPPELPLDFEGFYLGHQEFFHDFAEIHLGSRRAAEDVVHLVFLEILVGWDALLQQGDLEQQALAVLHRGVTRRLKQDGRPPAFLINGPIATDLAAIRSQLEISGSTNGLYEAILELLHGSDHSFAPAATPAPFLHVGPVRLNQLRRTRTDR